MPSGCTLALGPLLSPGPPQWTPAPSPVAQPNPAASPPRVPPHCTHSMDNSGAKCHPGPGTLCAHWKPPPRRAPAAPNRGHPWPGGPGWGRGGCWPHLILIGPEQADRQLGLVPLAAMRAGRVPDGAAHQAPGDPHIGTERARAVAIPAEHEVAELEAVGIILTQCLEEQVSFLAWAVLRGVHHQVGAWGSREGGENGVTMRMVKGLEEPDRGWLRALGVYCWSKDTEGRA